MSLSEEKISKVRLKKRVLRIRKKIFGTKDVPRLAVYRSLKHTYAQVINDESAHTLASCSTLCKEIREELKNKTKTEQAKIVGEHLAKKLNELKIKNVVFDRRGRKYIGRIKSLAEAVRSGGIKF